MVIKKLLSLLNLIEIQTLYFHKLIRLLQLVKIGNLF